MENPLYLQGNYLFFNLAAKPLQNCRETPRNPFEFWQVSQGFDRVSRHAPDVDQIRVK